MLSGLWESVDKERFVYLRRNVLVRIVGVGYLSFYPNSLVGMQSRVLSGLLGGFLHCGGWSNPIGRVTFFRAQAMFN